MSNSKTYELQFLPSALKEWRRLDATTKEQFKQRLAARLINPHVDTATLYGMPGCYKIKLRTRGLFTLITGLRWPPEGPSARNATKGILDVFTRSMTWRSALLVASPTKAFFNQGNVPWRGGGGGGWVW